MVFVDNSFIEQENMQRLAYAGIGAFAIHALVLVWFTLPASQNITSADIFSPPTNVSIRFVNPIKKPPEISHNIVKPKPVIKNIAKTILQKPLPKILNKIEPAAPPPRTYQPAPHPVQNIIPVISEANIKGRRIKPEYPKRSLRMRQEGIVWLRVLISDTGARQDIKLYKPSQHALLNQAAIKAVKKWTFDPNIVNGRAVQSWVEIPIEFKIR